MVQVYLIWYGEQQAWYRHKFVAWMPQCPRVGETVSVPQDEPDEWGFTDQENTKHMVVERVTWACNGTINWHAEVHLR